MRRIGVLTGGGDAPGLNAVIRAVARRFAAEGIEAVGRTRTVPADGELVRTASAVGVSFGSQF